MTYDIYKLSQQLEDLARKGNFNKAYLKDQMQEIFFMFKGSNGANEIRYIADQLEANLNEILSADGQENKVGNKSN